MKNELIELATKVATLDTKNGGCMLPITCASCLIDIYYVEKTRDYNSRNTLSEAYEIRPNCIELAEEILTKAKLKLI